MRRPMLRSRGRARGFTLIELLVAAALMAVLAVLSWRGLDAVLESRRRIVDASDELRSLTLAFSQLDEDLRRSWPVRLLKLRAPSIGFTVAGEQAVATLELLREATGATEPTQLQRVAWRLRDGVLERGFGAWVAPGTDGSSAMSAGAAASFAQAGPDAAGGLVWQPILGQVAQLQMQGWVAQQGWIAAEALAGQLTGAGTGTAGLAGGAGTGAAGGAGTGAAGGSGTGAGGAGAAGVPVTGGTNAAVTGLLVRVVRTDGRVLQRILTVKD